jgi:S-DNA-T family DNA segregation ATPase FtsK/SpoIIIE
VGAYLSDGLLQLFGWPAYLWGIGLLIFGVLLFFEKPLEGRWGKLGGIFSFLVSLSIWLGLWGLVRVDMERSFPLGGILGEGLASWMRIYLNTVGTWIVATAMLLLGLTLVWYRSPIEAGMKGIQWTRRAIQWSRQFLIPKIVWLWKRYFYRPKIRENLGPKVLVPTPVEGETLLSPVAKKGEGEILIQSQAATQQHFEFIEVKGRHSLPALSFLDYDMGGKKGLDSENYTDKARIMERKLRDFSVEGRVVEVCPGPVITLYEYEPAPGVKLNRIVNLEDDLSIALKADSVRIVAPIPGKGVVGIEVPNRERETVYLKEIIGCEEFQKSRSKLTLALGKDISGAPVVADLAKMPHLLVAGATGSGKSVCLNTFICSLLYKSLPEDVRLLMIDPKMLELSLYEGIPHLLHPVVTNPKEAAIALRWTVREMERRYQLLNAVGVRHIERFNQKVNKRNQEITIRNSYGQEERVTLPEKLPYIIVIIDELADLMIVAGRDVEESITRLSQMARAGGIHLIVATQRPSVDILTGVIKANFPARIAFQVSSKVDSRTIIDTNGAEQLLGSGDMLFMPPGSAKLQRIHGGFVSEIEIKRMVDYLKTQGIPEYDRQITEPVEDKTLLPEEELEDGKYDEAVTVVMETRQASISMVQRRLRIGYNRAARMIERMEKEGLVGPADGSRPREILRSREL